MRFLIITDTWEPQVNGVVRTYQSIMPHLESMGHIVGVIGPHMFRSWPLPGYNEIRLVPFAPRLTRMIEDFRPDAIHIAVEGFLGRKARAYCIRRNIPFTTCYHTQFPDYIAKRVALFGRGAAKAAHAATVRFLRNFHAPSSCLFVATPSLEAQLRDWDFKTPMRRLSRGVDHALFHPGPSPLFSDRPGPVFLYVGRVAVEKTSPPSWTCRLKAPRGSSARGPTCRPCGKNTRTPFSPA